MEPRIIHPAFKFVSLVFIMGLGACAPKEEMARISFNFEANKADGLAALTLPTDHCYGIHVTGPGLWKMQEDSSEGCSGAAGLGSVFGLYAKGQTAEISVPIGSQRRFDLVAFPKSAVPGGVCTGTLSVVVNDPNGGPGSVTMKVGSTVLADNIMRYFATGTKDIVAGDNVVSMSSATADSAGLSYGCNHEGYGGITVEEGATHTPSNFVNIYMFHSSDVQDVQFSTEDTCQAGEGWVSLSGPTTVMDLTFIDPSDGPRDIYYQYRNAALEETECKLGGSIILDTTYPTLAITTPAGGSTFFTDTLAITGTCDEDVNYKITASSGNELGRGKCIAASGFGITADLGGFADGATEAINIGYWDEAGNSNIEPLVLTKNISGLASVGVGGMNIPPDMGEMDLGKIPVNTKSFVNSLKLANVSSAIASSLSVSVSAPFYFDGGSYPGTGGDCSSTLMNGTECIIKIYAQRATAGAVTGNLTLTYNDTAVTITKNIPLRAEFYTQSASSAKRLLMVMTPGETFINGYPNSPPIDGIQDAYTVKSTPITFYALDKNNYRVNSYTQPIYVEGDAAFTPVSSSMVAGAKSISAIFPYPTSSEVRAYSNYLIPVQQWISVQDFCSAPPMGTGASGGQFQDGTGTAANPWIVCDETQMDLIATNDGPTKNFALVTDVYMGSNRTSLLGSTCTGGFQGTFDGNGWNLDASMDYTSGEMCSGLFGRIDGGTVKDLKLNLMLISHQSYDAGSYTGGITGTMSTGSISNVKVYWNSVSTSAENVGGIVGLIGGTAGIEDSHVELNSGNTIAGQVNLGGIAAEMTGGNIIRSSVSNDPMLSAGDIVGSVAGASGGLVGTMAGGTISRCFVGAYGAGNSIDIRENLLMGGLVGNLMGAGAVVGDSYAYTTSSSGMNGMTGGIAGGLSAGAIEHSYYAGAGMTSTGGDEGGIVGNRTGGSIVSSYYNDDVWAVGTAVGGGGSTAGTGSVDNLPNLISFTGWNFSVATGSWMRTAVPGALGDDGFPRLRWELKAKIDPNFNSYFMYPSEGRMTIPSYEYEQAQGSILTKDAGKWYWEVKIHHGESAQTFGVIESIELYDFIVVGDTPNSWAIVSTPDGRADIMKESLATSLASSARPRTGDVMRFALDLDNGTLRIFRNATEITGSGGTPIVTGIPSGTDYTAAWSISAPTSGADHDVEFNFGTKPFAYPTLPTGYKPYNYLGGI